MAKTACGEVPYAEACHAFISIVREVHGLGPFAEDHV